MNIKFLPIVYPGLGFALLFSMWEIGSLVTKGELPSPIQTIAVFFKILVSPFYKAAPNYKNIGIHLLASLKYFLLGFGIGTLIAVPIGFVIGYNKVIFNILNPAIEVLRPVSSLAWLPLGLVLMKVSEQSVLVVTIITSLWPTLINTALGVASVLVDHKNIGKAFGFSHWKYITKILLPSSLPFVITGLRLSIGVAWIVVFAAEMLSGGIGIGFFVWDSWNTLNFAKVMSPTYG